MKGKATTTRVVVRNGKFIAAVKESAAERTVRQKRIAEQVQTSGVVSALVEVNKKSATDRKAAVKK